MLNKQRYSLLSFLDFQCIYLANKIGTVTKLKLMNCTHFKLFCAEDFFEFGLCILYLYTFIYELVL